MLRIVYCTVYPNHPSVYNYEDIPVVLVTNLLLHNLGVAKHTEMIKNAREIPGVFPIPAHTYVLSVIHLEA